MNYLQFLAVLIFIVQLFIHFNIDLVKTFIYLYKTFILDNTKAIIITLVLEQTRLSAIVLNLVYIQSIIGRNYAKNVSDLLWIIFLKYIFSIGTLRSM